MEGSITNSPKRKLLAALNLSPICPIQVSDGQDEVGVYQIPSGVNMLDVFGILLRGKSVSISVTIPEGKNLFKSREFSPPKTSEIARLLFSLQKTQAFPKTWESQPRGLKGIFILILIKSPSIRVRKIFSLKW